MITDRRNRLAAEIIEASECTNSWSRAGLLGEAGLELDAGIMTVRDEDNVEDTE